MNNFFVASTLANDPHTEGMHNAGRIAKSGGIDCIILKPSLNYDDLFNAIKKFQPRFIGLSYRLSPKIGADEMIKVLYKLVETGLLHREDDVKVCFAGLPETIKILSNRKKEFPYPVYLVPACPDPVDRIIDTVDFFEFHENRDQIIMKFKEEAIPEGIKLLDGLANEVIKDDNYLDEPPLNIPSNAAKTNYVTRIKESNIPLLRSHFGIPDSTIEPTVNGIRRLAEARVIDEISLGSSDLSQRYFGHPEMFDVQKNDGGVPYKSFEDLVRLYEASRFGNFPSVKPYAHVADMVNFVDICLQSGMLTGAHQAVPLYWFNELDGRGGSSVRDSIYEHFATVRELARRGIPVEMNDPNQWSSRLSHDTIIVTSYALISSVMNMCGVENMLMQMQFNKPKETGDYGDIAKMMAGMEIAALLNLGWKHPANIYRETRTGIESLSPDMERAKWQLARSTLLQMCLQPHVIHIVSYCEANYAAKPDDIINSSKLVRHAVRLYNQHKKEIEEELGNPIITERKNYLLEESEYLLRKIAGLNPSYSPSVPLNKLASYIGLPDVIASSIEQRIMSVPGIINERYKSDYLTKATRYGMINLVSPEGEILKESSRFVC